MPPVASASRLQTRRRTPDGVGRYNHFSGSGGSSIYWTPTSGAHSVQGAIRTKWASLGWEAGPLGYPITDEKTTPDGVGRYNHFSGAVGHSIYWSPKTGAHGSPVLIRAKWASLGWEAGPLGYPTTDEKASPDGVGRYNHFSGAVGHSIYWSPKTGAHWIAGADSGQVGGPWAGSTGPLGYPTTDEMAAPDGVGRYNHFSGPVGHSIYWSPKTGAHWVTGAIRSRWASLGWERGRLGYPTRDEYSVSVGRASDFERGRLTWNSTTSQVTG